MTNEIRSFADDDQLHRPITVEQIGWVFHITCLCGEVFKSEVMLAAWERGAKHAGVELR